MENKELKVLDLGCNLFHFKINNQRKSYTKYLISFSPSIDSDSLIYKVWDYAKPQFTKNFSKPLLNLEHMIFFKSYFYSTEHLSEDFSIIINYENVEYSISVKFISNIDQNSHEIINVYQDFMKKIIKRLKFGRMKDFFYNKNNVSFINKQLGDIEIWHGFTYGIKRLSSDVFLNLNISHKVISNESILDWIKSHSDKTPSEINNLLKGTVIVTKYNKNQTYIINSIDFSKTPNSIFSSKYGEITFYDYVNAKYNIQLKELVQPLIIIKDKKSKNEIFLIPELCFLTGISQEIKQNYYLMKEIASIIKQSSKKKFDECKKILYSFNSSEKTKDLCNLYKISISTEPIYISGKRLPAGEMILHKNEIGDREKITIDDNYEIDRQLQTPLYSQPPLNNWRIFAYKSDSKIVENFIDLLMQVKSTFLYPMDMPLVSYVNGSEFFHWESQINNIKSFDPYQILIFIIPGNKERNILYNNLKKCTLNLLQCPSQIVLTETITKAKNIKAVMNKLFIQIVAKISGEPWVINDVPFTDMPTMVCGIDSYDGVNNKVFGICSSINKNFTRYASGCFENKDYQENIRTAMNFGFKNFADVVGVIPLNCIIFRNNFEEKSAKKEIEEILVFLKEIKESHKIEGYTIKLTYILLNRKCDLKIMLYNNYTKEYESSPAGTIVRDSKICGENEFYMISQKYNMNNYATKYKILYDNNDCSIKDLYSFIYKLSHLYFNFSSSIKVPAPCQYVWKLVRFVGEKLFDEEKNKLLLPGPRLWEKHKSLYFL